MNAVRLSVIGMIFALWAISQGELVRSVAGKPTQVPYEVQWQSEYLGGIPVWIARFTRTPALHKDGAYLFVQLGREYFADDSLREVFTGFAASQEKDRPVYVWVADDRDSLMRRITATTAYYRATSTGQPRLSACMTPEPTTNPYEVYYSRSDRGEYFTYAPYSPTKKGRKVVLRERTIPYTGDLETDLFLAIREYDVGTAKTLASKVTRIEFATPDGDTPLMLAVLKREDEVVTILLERGASVRARSKEGWTALMYAVSNSDVPTMQKLLVGGAAIEATIISGESVLSLASLGGHAETIRTLLNSGANVNHRDRDGKTPLLIAVESGRSEAAAIVLAAGADPLAKPGVAKQRFTWQQACLICWNF